MKSTIDSAGRLVLPKPIREAANLEGGTEVEIRVVGDHVEIEAVPLEIWIKEKDGFVIAVPRNVPARPLTSEKVEAVRMEVEKEREQSAGIE